MAASAVEPKLVRKSTIFDLEFIDAMDIKSYVISDLEKFSTVNPECKLTYHISEELVELPHFVDKKFLDVHINFEYKKVRFHFGLLWYSPLVYPICYSYENEASRFYLTSSDHTITMFYIGPRECFSFNTGRVYRALESTKATDVIYSVFITMQMIHNELLTCVIDSCIITSHNTYRYLGSIQKRFVELSDVNYVSSSGTPFRRIRLTLDSFSELQKGFVCVECSKIDPSTPPHAEEEFAGLRCDITNNLLITEESKVTESFFITMEKDHYHVYSEVTVKQFTPEIKAKHIAMLYIPKTKSYDVEAVTEKSCVTAAPITPFDSQAALLCYYYVKSLQALEMIFCEKSATPSLAYLMDLIRSQFNEAYNASPEFAKLMEQYAFHIKYDLFKNDRRVFYKPIALPDLLTLFPIVCNFDEAIDVTQAVYSVLIELFARKINQIRTDDLIANYRKVLCNCMHELHKFSLIASVFTDPDIQVSEFIEFKKLVKAANTLHPEDKTFHEDERNLVQVLALRFNIWDKFCSDDKTLTTWDRTSTISVKPFIEAVQNRAKKYKYFTSEIQLVQPKRYDHEIVTSVFLKVPHTGQTKRYPLMRCQECSTYGTRDRFRISDTPARMNQYIKRRNVFLVKTLGPAFIVDYSGHLIGATNPQTVVKFKSCKTKYQHMALQTQTSKLRAQFLGEERKLFRLQKRKRRYPTATQWDETIEKLETRVTALDEKYKEITALPLAPVFEKVRFDKIVVKLLTDGTEHTVTPADLSCNHHHHCRTRPTHHKPIWWSERNGVKNFELLALLPHTRLALAIQALFRMRRVRRRYLTMRHLRSKSFVEQVKLTIIAPALANVSSALS